MSERNWKTISTAEEIQEEEPCLRNSQSDSLVICNGSSNCNLELYGGKTKKGKIHRSKKLHRSDSTVILQIDRSNFCILSALLLLLILITSAIAFVLGQWSGIRSYDSRSEEETEKTDAKDVSAALSDIWRKAEQKEWRVARTPITRLPRDVIPVNYDLHLNLNEYRTEDTVSGEVTVLLECVRQTNRITFNAATNLDIANASIIEARTGKEIEWKSLERSSKIQIFTIKTAEDLIRGTFYKLFLSFKTKICDSKSGVHCYQPDRTSRKPRQTSPRPILLTTKLEPNLAKTLFPCWDEPDLKAIFNISITHAANTKVLSNAAIYKQTSDRKSQSATDYFHETPPMSTYLLAMAAGPLVAIEKESNRGIKVSTWTLPEDHFKAEFASEYAVYMFNMLEEYLVVKYPLSKLDLVASRNFPVGGMENWGLIVFHYDMLLVDEDEDEEGSGEMPEYSSNDPPDVENLLPKYRTSKIIIHELLHQWFGNLVTMSWWSDLWLNEGFTTFFANHFIAKTYSMLAEYEHYMRLGELWTRQTYGEKAALVRKFETEESIAESFDQWNLYCKGSVAIKMLWDLLGEQTLRGGVIEYLRTNAYGSVSREDLWKHLRRMSHFSLGNVEIGQVMESWVTQPGFPEIHIIRNYERERKGEVVVKQRLADAMQNQIFMQHSGMLKPESNPWKNLTWAIPLLYIIQGQPSQSRPFWIWNSTFTFQDLDLKNSKWLLANANFQFPYRINYDRRNWHKLIHALYRNPKSVPGRSRTQLILDAALFLKDSYDLPLYIELLGYLRNETELLPLLAGLRQAHSLLDEFRASPIYSLLLVCLRPIATQLVKRRNESRLSSEESAIWSLDERRLREYHRFRCAMNEESCQISRSRAQQILLSPGSAHQSLRIAVCQFLHNQHTDAEQMMVLRSLEDSAVLSNEVLLLAACVKDRFVNEKLSEILVKKQNIALLGRVFESEYSLHINRDLRKAVLKKLGRLSGQEKSRVFRKKNLTRIFLNSVRSVDELELAETVIPSLQKEKDYLRLKLTWMENSASPMLERWLLRVLKLR